jgi:uncharacterized protein (TIGR02594 family)
MNKMGKLPEKYKWLLKESGPLHMLEALKHYGLLETAGKGSTVDIMKWAKETGVSGWYSDDSVPWCGLFVGICMKRATWPIKPTLLSALSWQDFGDKVAKGQESYGDILVFIRPGGGHVGFYVGESKTAFLVLGGNQSDSVSLTWVAKDRLVACRRPHWRSSQPTNVRKIYLEQDGTVSKNEA